MHLLPCLCRALALAATLAAPLAAQVSVTLTADRDNTLYEDPAGMLSNGAGDRIFAGKTLADLDRRAVLHFDVAGAVPAGSTIRSAELALEVVKSRPGSSPLSVATHRLLADWGEGTSVALRGQGAGALATTGDATWLHTFFSTAMWQSAGGDFASTASATASAPLRGAFRFPSTAAAVSDVQGWLDRPAQNFGWLVLGDPNAVGDARAFAAREAANATSRPRLLLSYDPPSAQVTSFGQGCAGPNGRPSTITTQGGLPQLGNNSFTIVASFDSGASLPAVAFADARLQSPITLLGCDVWLDPTALLGAAAVGSQNQVALPVPNHPALLGFVLYAQGVALDPSGPRPLTSNALAIRIGT